MAFLTITAHNSQQKFSNDDLGDLDVFEPVNGHLEARLSRDDIRDHFTALTSPHLADFASSFSSINWDGSDLTKDQLVHRFAQLGELNRELKQMSDQNRVDGWGYPQLNAVKKEIPPTLQDAENGVYWYQFGSFTDDKRWKVDRKRIKAILRQEADDQMLTLCPAFELERVFETVDRLPEIIDTEKNSNWKIRYESIIDDNRIEKKATGIVHKLSLGEDLHGMTQREKAETGLDSTERRIPDVSFDEIGGIDPILQKIREVIELPLKNPGLFEHMGITPHRGILLYGPPGCGKTMIAKAIANEIDAHFVSVKGPELLNRYYGQSEENLRNLFEEASRMQPSIIFFDEIDSIAQRRSGADNLRIEAKFVNQMLTLMDGIEDYGNISVIAATNRPELIDEALLRRGRFDYQLEVPRPDADGLTQILDIHTEEKPLAKSVVQSNIVQQLTGATGADIAYMVREAAFNCLRRNLSIDETLFDVDDEEGADYSRFTIEQEDFELALEDFTPPGKKD